MGNYCMTMVNETPYVFSYTFSYLGSDRDLQHHAVLQPGQKISTKQREIISLLYVKSGSQNKEACRWHADLWRQYTGIDNPTFYIRVCNWDRSKIQLVCNRGGDAPVCPNYAKQNEDRLAQEKQRQEAERKQREEAERKQREEEKRRQERQEREKRIAEDIERENKSLEERLTKTSEKLKQRSHQRGRTNLQERSQILQYAVEDDAEEIDIHEEKDVEEKFKQFLIDINMIEEKAVESQDIGDRMKKLQQQLMAQFFVKKEIPIWCLRGLENTFDYENISLTEQMSLLKATAQVTLKEAEMKQYKDKIDDISNFRIRIMDVLYNTNKTLAGKLSRAVFSELSSTSQDFLGHILFSGMWTPMEAVQFTLKVQEIRVPQEKVEAILQRVQTYQIDVNTATASLKEQDPMLPLQQHVKNEQDKDLKTILAEMRRNNYPEKVVTILDKVLSEVGARLPAYQTLDLDEAMKKEGIAMTRSINLENPDIEKLVNIFIGLCVAVQDTTTIVKQSGEKIEGYFPRMTQLASVLTLLISNAPGCNGCLMEIFTGEGKSSIVAMLALIHAIRGKKVDVITSSPVLARRDQEEWSQLYKMFDVSCSVVPPPGLDECTDSRESDKAIQQAYAADIVYGTIGNFAADVLRQDFEKCKTRGNRTFDLAIVDEVDYMTLDSGVQVTFLSHAATGMRHLEQLLAAIWAKVCTCQRIQESKTGEILWATGTQYFHKVAATAVMGPKTSEHFSPLEILMPGLQLGFFSEADVKQIELLVDKTEETVTETPEGSAIKDIMDKLGPDEQRDLLSIFQKILEDAVVFDCYELKDGKASPFEDNSTSDNSTSDSNSGSINSSTSETSCTADKNPTSNNSTPDNKTTAENKPTSEHDKICILLQEHGRACELMSNKDLVEGAVRDLESRIRYSDTYQPPDKQQSNDENVILLPGYLKAYTQNRLAVFVENALKALTMVKDREYMIESTTDTGRVNVNAPIHEYHSIIPVDFKATGVLEKNKRWGDGLQQFLELKHQLAISPLSDVTNFMSNFHFLQRYTKGTGMFGVSGTLGDEAEVEFLKKHYKVSSYIMPTHRYTKKTELPILQVEGGHDAWIKSICGSVKERTSANQWGKGQAALVVCEDVKTAEKLQNELIELKVVSDSGKIALYTRSDKHNIEKRIFGPGDVIIATNLGGRGTDVKITKDVNESGGLFVILTHFPANMRVEKQIFGRTSRKGNPGMVQMILNYESLLPSYQGQPIEVMRQLRADYEKKRMTDMEGDELLEIQIREELFVTFCEHLNVFQQNYNKEEKQDIYTTSDSAKGEYIFDPSKKKLDYRPALNALKESWALWLTLHEKDIDKHKDIKELKKDLDQVIQRRADSLLRGESDNFYDFIKQAMDRMYLHTQNKASDFGALSFWQKAEKTDRVYRAVSLYNQAYITINLGQEGYMQKAIDLLKESKQMIDVYVSEVSNTIVACQMSCLAKFEPHNKDNPNFTKQMQTRKSLFKSWIDYIDNSVAKLTELQKKKNNAITKDQAVFTLSADHNPITSDELIVLYDYGLSFVFEVEKKPEFCINALICFILGALQVLAGILVCVFTCGTASQIGMGLISEGVSDMISGIEGMVKGTFDWAEWAISKAISIGLSLITAGFSLIKKAAMAIFKVTKSLLNGSKTFASLADDIIRTGKAVASSIRTSAKSTVSAVSKKALSGSLKTLASSSAIKKNLGQVIKYTGQEIAKQGTLKAIEYVMDEALQAVFKKIFEDAFKDLIAKSIKGDKTLNQSIIKFIIINGVPETALKIENQSTFQIRDAQKQIMNKILEDVCKSAVANVSEDYSTLNKFFTHLNTIKNGILQILEKAKVSGAIQKGFKLSVAVAKSVSEFVQMLNSCPTQDMIEKKVIPFMVKEFDGLPSAADYKEDGRRNFPDVEAVKVKLLDVVSQKLSDNFTELLSSNLTSLINKPIREEMNKHVGKTVDNILGRNKTERFFIEQKHQRKMKKTPVEGEKIKLTEAEQKEVNDYVKKMEDTSCPATELDLNILTKSDLLEGKGIKVIVVDENQKNISTEIYPGKDSTTGVITLQLQKVKERSEGDSDRIKQIKDRIKGNESLYKGQFNLVAADGSVIRDQSEDKNSLYRALTLAKGVHADQDITKEAAVLKTKVHKEISENQGRYGALVKRQLEFEKLCTKAGKYTIQAGDAPVGNTTGGEPKDKKET
ncbi:uncharacterized protein LOC144817699 [Lissotriton helveticus]